MILHSRYPGQIAPWIDEGIACLYNDRDSKNIANDVIDWYRETGNWPSVISVMEDDRIARWDQASYAVSTSVVEFLLTRGDKAQLLAFAIDGQKQGWDAALRTHYKIAAVSELERSWRAWISNRLDGQIGG
jgi:hypothetical protein